MSSIPAAKEKTSARAVLEAWDRRVTELLAANNSYLERARRAEAESANLKLDRDMWKGLAGKLDVQLAEAMAERDEAREALKTPEHRTLYWRNAYELLVAQTGRDINDGYGIDPRKAFPSPLITKGGADV